MQSEDSGRMKGENPKYKLQGKARSYDCHPHPLSGETEGYQSRNPGEGGEALENITFSVVLNTLVQVTHILS